MQTVKLVLSFFNIKKLRQIYFLTSGVRLNNNNNNNNNNNRK